MNTELCLQHLNGTESYALHWNHLLLHAVRPLYASPSICQLSFIPLLFSLFNSHYLLPQRPSFPCTNNCSYTVCSRTHLLRLREPLLRRQAWVERPLGSGSRYCRTERWSILDHCSSTEQWGEAKSKYTS